MLSQFRHSFQSNIHRNINILETNKLFQSMKIIVISYKIFFFGSFSNKIVVKKKMNN